MADHPVVSDRFVKTNNLSTVFSIETGQIRE
jgi:hypothetical protein